MFASVINVALKPRINFFFFQFQITTNKMQSSLIYLFLQTLYRFQAVPPPIIS